MEPTKQAARQIIEKFSLKVLDAVDRAGRLAVKQGHRHTTEWHLFAAMLQQDDTHLKQLLMSAEVDLDVLGVQPACPTSPSQPVNRLVRPDRAHGKRNRLRPSSAR